MSVWKILLYIVLAAALIVALITAGAVLQGCRTFSPIWMEQLPPECNMSLNAMRLYYATSDKSGTVPPVDACYRCLNRLRCQAEVFGLNDKGEPNPVIYTGTKYRDFEQCRSELK